MKVGDGGNKGYVMNIALNLILVESTKLLESSKTDNLVLSFSVTKGNKEVDLR